MPGYALITDYGGRGDCEDIGVDFFDDKRALNKHVRIFYPPYLIITNMIVPFVKLLDTLIIQR